MAFFGLGITLLGGVSKGRTTEQLPGRARSMRRPASSTGFNDSSSRSGPAGKL